jgi:hypothetical protein
MRDLPDDPIVASIERTGYPPWMEPEWRTADDAYEEEEEDDLPPCTMTWAEIEALLERRKGENENAL